MQQAAHLLRLKGLDYTRNWRTISLALVLVVENFTYACSFFIQFAVIASVCNEIRDNSA
ncbi:hypothetical protein N431DRAFT_24259 [Stipitochalara longipes BDJ]|nr:hypothetical protein N431DRAFT_24259 [Stipitochalara longipes BDJ]